VARLQVIASLPALELTKDVLELSNELLSTGMMPQNAGNDAIHLCIAAIHSCEYLLTWNCRHLANAEIQRGARSVANAKGWELRIVCTPEELMGVNYENT
jgi:hypothetical protein